VLGDDVTIGDEVYCNGASVLPHKSIKSNVDGKYSPRVDEEVWRMVLTLLQRLRSSCESYSSVTPAIYLCSSAMNGFKAYTSAYTAFQEPVEKQGLHCGNGQGRRLHTYTYTGTKCSRPSAI